MTTMPELIKRLNEIKNYHLDQAAWGSDKSTIGRDEHRRRAKAIATAVRLLAGTKRRKS